MLFLLDALASIRKFFDSGGPVLVLIAIVTFAMWVLILERFWYCRTAFFKDLQASLAEWQSRSDHDSWYADAVRRMIVSDLQIKIQHNMRLIKAMIALCPLFGLLGTVSGMIDVFSVLSLTGGGDPRSMASGVSRATIPTMAGMVGALSGIFANMYLTQLVSKRRSHVAAQLAPEH